MSAARLELLGGFRLISGSGRDADIQAKKNRALIGILAMAPLQTVTRDRLTGLLWSDRADEQARNSLRQALVALRKDFAALDADPLVLNGDRVGLDPKTVSIDVVEFLAASASADSTGLRQAADLYAGPFLDGLNAADDAFEEWLREARADLVSRATRVLESLAGMLAGDERIAASERLVALDPLREASHRLLIEAYLAKGERPLAIKQYEACKLILKRELGVAPGTELQKLRRSLEAPDPRPSLSLPPDRKPTIAVLPFDNMSGDPAQQYFSDGMTEDIIARLSKYRILSVIGGHSSFALRGRDTEMQEIRNKLSADYVLTGNIRKSENRIRIAARLTDARTEAALWADRYDRPLQDIFAVQDEVASIIASTLMGRVQIEIATRSQIASPAGLSSYEHVLQGMWHFRKLSVAAVAMAANCFEKAIAAYPENAEAHRWLASCHNNAWFLDFSREELAKGLDQAARAIELDPASAGCYAVHGLCQLWLEGVDAAATSYQKALSLSPADPGVLIEAALLNVYSGNLPASYELFDQAFRLNPLPPLWYAEFRSVAEFVEGRYAQALPAFAAIPYGGWDVMYTMTCLGHLEDRDQAIACRSRFQAEGRKWDLLAGAAAEPFRDPEPRQRLIAGITKAMAF
jgi:TolB-like protein